MKSAARRVKNTGAEDEKIRRRLKSKSAARRAGNQPRCGRETQERKMRKSAAVRTGNPLRGAWGICCGACGEYGGGGRKNPLRSGRKICCGARWKSAAERAGNTGAAGEKIRREAGGKHRRERAFNIEETCAFCSRENCGGLHPKISPGLSRKSRPHPRENLAHARAKISLQAGRIFFQGTGKCSKQASVSLRQNHVGNQARFSRFFLSKNHFNRTGITQ